MCISSSDRIWREDWSSVSLRRQMQDIRTSGQDEIQLMEQRELRCSRNECTYCHHPRKWRVTQTGSPVHCEEGGDVVISEQQKSGQPAFQQTPVGMETCNKNTKNQSPLIYPLFKIISSIKSFNVASIKLLQDIQKS